MTVWKTATIGSVCSTYSGGTPSTSRPEYYGGDIPWIASADLNCGRISSVNGRITRLGLERSSAKLVKPGTPLIALYGATAGVAAVTYVGGAINQAILAMVPRDIDAEYLYQWLRANRDQIIDRYTQGGQPNLSGEIVRNVELPLPSPAEQRRIATALRDVDDLIATLERLIAKKQAIKQGMMQQIFAVKMSENRSLESIASWLSGGTPDRNNPAYWGGDIPWISASSLRGSRISDSEQRLTDAGLRAGSRLAPKGAALILVRGMALHRETRIGLAVRPVSINQDVKAIIPSSKVDSEFLTYALQARSHQIRELVSSAGSGTGVLDIGLLKQLQIWVPDLRKQRSIVSIVRDVDESVTLLRSLIVKKQAIRQGMMQQLLTGRTRLPVEEAPV